MKISKNKRGANPDKTPDNKTPEKKLSENERRMILNSNRLNEKRLRKRKSFVAYPKNYNDLDKEAFDAAVDHALGTDDETFPRLSGEAAKGLRPRFFEAAAAATRAIEEGKKRKPGKGDAHVISLLQSKLYLETTSGKLPTKKAVREYAIKVFETWFTQYGLKPNKNKSELWKDYFTEAGLDYLPDGTRGTARK